MVFSRKECLKCGLCCIETSMILLNEDITRLENLGFKREDFAEFRDGFASLYVFVIGSSFSGAPPHRGHQVHLLATTPISLTEATHNQNI